MQTLCHAVYHPGTQPTLRHSSRVYNTLSWQYPLFLQILLFFGVKSRTTWFLVFSITFPYICSLCNKTSNSGQSYVTGSPSFFTPWTSPIVSSVVFLIPSFSTFLWHILCPGDYPLKTSLDSAIKEATAEDESSGREVRIMLILLPSCLVKQFWQHPCPSITVVPG